MLKRAGQSREGGGDLPSVAKLKYVSSGMKAEERETHILEANELCICSGDDGGLLNDDGCGGGGSLARSEGDPFFHGEGGHSRMNLSRPERRRRPGKMAGEGKGVDGGRERASVTLTSAG